MLQLDCPDLAMTAPGAGSLENFRREMELNIEALNHALADIPAEAMRIHICWGNGEFPRTRDVELKDIIDIVLKAKPAGLMLMAWFRPSPGRSSGPRPKAPRSPPSTCGAPQPDR